MNIVLLAQVIKRPQPLPLRGHGGLYCELVSWCCLCWCSVFQRFKWLSAVSAFDCFSVFVTTQQHRSLVWLRGPQKTRACQVDVLESLPVRLSVVRSGLLNPQGHRQGGHCHRRLLILRGAVFGEVLPHGDAGKRILSIREAIERRLRLFTLAVREGHLELLGFGSRVQARIRVRRLTKLRLLHLQLQLT